MHSFQFKNSSLILSAKSIQSLRKYTALSFSELKRRAVANEPLLEYAILDNSWEESETIIKKILIDIETGILPLKIYELYQSFDVPNQDAELLSPAALRSRLQMIEEIRLEQDRATQLECGYLNPEEEDESAN